PPNRSSRCPSRLRRRLGFRSEIYSLPPRPSRFAALWRSRSSDVVSLASGTATTIFRGLHTAISNGCRLPRTACLQDCRSASDVSLSCSPLTVLGSFLASTLINCGWNDVANFVTVIPVSETPVVTKASCSRRIIVIVSVLFLLVLLRAHSQIPSPSQTPLRRRGPGMLNDYRTPSSRSDVIASP